MKTPFRSILRLPWIFPVLAVLLIRPVLAGQAPDKPAKPGRAESARFNVVRASVPIRIDGVLDEQAWTAAPKIPVPFGWQPGDNTPAPVDTEVLVTYDLHSIYIGFRCFDPEPRKIRAHLMDRDRTRPTRKTGRGSTLLSVMLCGLAILWTI